MFDAAEDVALWALAEGRGLLPADARARLAGAPPGQPLARALVEGGLLSRDQLEGLRGELARRRGGQAPARVGPYRLERELGRGSCGVVHLARRDGLDRAVAVKVLDAAFLEAEAVERFRLEAHVASKLRDPGLIGVFDVGRDGDRHYYAMEYCPGPTLAEQLRTRGRLEPLEAAALVEQVARAVAAAHQQGIVHRDLKPGNVLLDQETGRPRVTDFGLARDGARVRRMTRTGEVIGTPYYMAPEQLRGEKDVDLRADVYALGVVLYECLTGARPFTGRTALELGERVLAGGARPPRELVPDLSAELEGVVLCAMATDRADRYLSAEALADDLARVQRGEAPSAGHLVLPGGRGRRRGVRAIGLVGGALAVAALGAWAAVLARGALRGDLRGDAASVSAAAPAPTADAAARTPAALLARAQELSRALAPLDVVLIAYAEARAACPDEGPLRLQVQLATAAYLLRRGQFGEAQRAAHEVVAAPRVGAAQRLAAQRLTAAALEGQDRREEAREAYRQLYHADPTGAIGLSGLAAAHRLGGQAGEEERSQRALEAARRALERDPHDVPALLEVARQRLDRGEAERARRAIARAREQAPDDPRVLYLEGLRRSRQGDVVAALPPLDQAVSLVEPNAWPGLLSARAEVYLAAGRPAEAHADLERALSVRPDDPALRVERGVVAWALGERAWSEPRWKRQAVQDWRAALDALGPEGFAALLEREVGPGDGRLVLEVVGLGPAPSPALGEVPPVGPALRMRLEAHAAAAQAPAREPLLVAMLAAAGGERFSQAAPRYAAATAAAPDCPVVALERARFLLGREAYEQAQAAIERARALGGPPKTLALWSGLLLWFRGKGHLAAPVFERLVTEGPAEDPVVLCARAWFLFAHDRDADAVRAARAATAAHADDALAWMILCLAQEAADKRRLPEAIAAARRAQAVWGGIDGKALLSEVYAFEDNVRYGPDGEPRAFLDADGLEALQQSIAGYERLFDLTAGPSAHLGAAQLALLLAGPNPWQRQIGEWLDEAARRQPDRGMTHLRRGWYALRQGEGRAAVMAAWDRAREVEPRLMFPQHMVDSFAQAFGEDDPALEDLRARVEAP